MSENDTKRLTEDDGSLAGDALIHALRQDLQGLFRVVKALAEKVEALDQKVEARLRDTTPMWEIVVARLDTIIVEQESQGRRLAAIETRLDAIEARLDAVEGRLDAVEGRLDAIEGKLGRLDVTEGEIRQLRGRNERMIGELSRDVVEVRAAQHDLEGRLEKLEKTPA